MKNYWLEKSRLRDFEQCWDWKDFASETQQQEVEKFNKRVREVGWYFKAVSITTSPEIISLWFRPTQTYGWLLTSNSPILLDVLIYESNNCGSKLILHYPGDTLTPFPTVRIKIKNLNV
jgi:hypothetical protein